MTEDVPPQGHRELQERHQYMQPARKFPLGVLKYQHINKLPAIASGRKDSVCLIRGYFTKVTKETVLSLSSQSSNKNSSAENRQHLKYTWHNRETRFIMFKKHMQLPFAYLPTYTDFFMVVFKHHAAINGF